MSDDLSPTDNLRCKFAQVVADIGNVTKTLTADTGSFTYDYASLNDVLSLVKDALSKHKLVMTQIIEEQSDSNQRLSTLITDMTTGALLVFPGQGMSIKGDGQAMGSALTYARRYSLVTLFAIEQDDDDGAMAHRADTSNGHRTAAETEIRDIIKGYDSEILAAYQNDFRAQFGSGLASLPESRHGEVLNWTRKWEASE